MGTEWTTQRIFFTVVNIASEIRTKMLCKQVRILESLGIWIHLLKSILQVIGAKKNIRKAMDIQQIKIKIG